MEQALPLLPMADYTTNGSYSVPTNATDATYTWSVANRLMCTIDANGLLTALTNGTVTVTAANDGSKIVTSDAVITISNRYIGKLNNCTRSKVGKLPLLPMAAHTNGSYGIAYKCYRYHITWSVANGTGSATIDANGLPALTNGTVTVTATANDGSGISGTKDITISNQGTAIKDIAFKD
ncbi:MAG: Ig-like domain-containing protein [Chitinophagales bacterium]